MQMSAQKIRRKANATEERRKREEWFAFLKASALWEEIWPDRGVGVFVWAAEGNTNIDYTK